MGLFSAIKDIFNKNIECGDDIYNHMLVFFKKKKYLYLGKNIIVRDGTSCVLVYKDRVCDIILPGKYKIASDVIPECYDRAKIDKRNNKGCNVKKIRVKLFYINTQEFENYIFQSKRAFVVKSKELGKIKGKLNGKCTVRVIDPALLIRYLLSQKRKVNSGVAKLEVGDLIGNKCNKLFQKKKIPFELLFIDRKKVNSILNMEIEDALDKNGVYVKNIEIKSVEIAKKHQGKVNDYIALHKKVTYNASGIGERTSIGDNFKIPITISNTPSNVRPEYKSCTHCGYKNNSSSISCRNCGKSL